jgi:hypothetical protein
LLSLHDIAAFSCSTDYGDRKRRAESIIGALLLNCFSILEPKPSMSAPVLTSQIEVEACESP